jgi:hypothetical protein
MSLKSDRAPELRRLYRRWMLELLALMGQLGALGPG